MGQSQSQQQNAVLRYKVDPIQDLDMTNFVLSDSSALNRKRGTTTLRGVSGVTHATDYLPSLKRGRRGGPHDEVSSRSRLTRFSLARQGPQAGVAAKILLNSQHPGVSQAGPPGLDILFRDRTKTTVGYQPIPKTAATTPKGQPLDGWMATSIHFDDSSVPAFRIQLTRTNYPFLVQLFDARSNTACASMLTFGKTMRTTRTIHVFRGNIDTEEKARDAIYSQLFAVLDEEYGTLSFQEALGSEVEKAVLCLLLLMRTRVMVINPEW